MEDREGGTVVDTRSPVVAILLWGILEDFLDPLGVSFEKFCQEFTGSYVFGYLSALQRAGVRPLLMCVSCRLTTPLRCTHRPTGASICILPAPRLLRALRPRIRNPHARNVHGMFGPLRGLSRLLYPLLALLRPTLLYLVTPVGRLAQEVRREKCTAILCQEYEYPRFDVCVLLGRLLRLPVFATFQGGNYQRSPLERFSRPLAMRFCAGLIIASETEETRVRQRYGVPATKIARVFNPVDSEVWAPLDRDTMRAKLGIPRSARVAVWHGRVSMRKKGLDTLLDAWRRVCAQRTGRDLRLLLIGDGEDAESLRHAISDLAVPAVHWIQQFLHDRAVLRAYLATGDVYVFPSRHEGFPVAPIEAMACGLPVAAADAHGIPEILAGGEASGGLIVPREDPEALAVAVGRFLDDVVWSREMARRARLRIETCFAPGPVGRQLRTFLWPLPPSAGLPRRRSTLDPGAGRDAGALASSAHGRAPPGRR
jgi:glycosyltransferase involved in cell wall biosynthesis